jgi:uncharacterized phage-like protein YoqJ
VIIAGTGHRPDKLGGFEDAVFERLTALARDRLRELRPEKVISGMALGWDQALAWAALDMGIPITAAVPFEGIETRWPQRSQNIFNQILDRVKEVHFVCSEMGPFKKAFQVRNEWMVDRADLMLALCDGSWGGTFNCIRYAEKKRVPVENLWSRWEMREILK